MCRSAGFFCRVLQRSLHWILKNHTDLQDLYRSVQIFLPQKYVFLHLLRNQFTPYMDFFIYFINTFSWPTLSQLILSITQDSREGKSVPIAVIVVTSGTQRIKFSSKFKKCAISNRTIQNGRPIKFRKSKKTQKRNKKLPRQCADCKEDTDRDPRSERRYKVTVVCCLFQKMSWKTQKRSTTCQWFTPKTLETSWKIRMCYFQCISMLIHVI